MKVNVAAMYRCAPRRFQVEASTLGWGAGYFAPHFEVENEVGDKVTVFKRTRLFNEDGFGGFEYVSGPGRVQPPVRVVVVND